MHSRSPLADIQSCSNFELTSGFVFQPQSYDVMVPQWAARQLALPYLTVRYGRTKRMRPGICISLQRKLLPKIHLRYQEGWMMSQCREY